MRTSWKTTVGGLLGALGIALKHAPYPQVAAWSDFAAAMGMVILGMAARDNGVSSEDVGVAPRVKISIPDNEPTKT